MIKICLRCGMESPVEHAHCPFCGAPLDGTPQTMYEAWKACSQRRTLGKSGAWNILWGVLIVVSGTIMLRESGLNALLLVIGLFLIGTGIATWVEPGPLTLRLDASALLVVGAWNVVISLANGLSGQWTWLAMGIVQIGWAIQRFRKHDDLARVQHVPPAVSRAVGALVDGTQRARVDRETDVIQLRTEGKRWKARLMPGLVVAVTGKGARQEVRFLPPGEVELQVSGEILERRWLAADVRLGGGRWPGAVLPETMERYAAWRAAALKEPGTGEEPGRSAVPFHVGAHPPCESEALRRGRPRAGRSVQIPVWAWLVAAIVAVLLVAGGGVLTYQLLGRRAFAHSEAAYRAGNFEQACPGMERVTRAYGLLGGSYVDQARRTCRECEPLLQADTDRASGAYAEAVAGYQRYLAAYPAGAFVPHAWAGLEGAYGDWSMALLDETKPSQALDVLGRAYAAYAGQPVPAAIERAFERALYGLAGDDGADGRATIAASWKAICAGRPATSQAVGLLVGEPPRAWFGGDVPLVPDEMAAIGPGNFRYAVCLEEMKEPVESCRYMPAGVIDRLQITWRMVVRDTLTGQPLQAQVFGGGMPDECPASWTFGPDARPQSLAGSPPQVGPVRAWVEEAIRTPPPAVTIDIKPPIAPAAQDGSATPIVQATPAAPLPPVSIDDIELTVWHNRSGRGEAALCALVDQYAAMHPRVRVTMHAAREQSEIESGLAAGSIDILFWSMTYLPEWAAQGTIVPLAYADPAWMREVYIAPAVDAAIVGDQVYGLPASASTAALIYNRALLADQDVPRTTDELLAQAQAWSGTGTYFTYPIGMPFFSAGWFHGGQSWWADDACMPRLDTPDGLAAAEWIAALGPIVPPDAGYDLGSEPLQAGQAPLALNGLWLLAALDASGIDYGLAPLPALSATGIEPAPYVEMSAWMIARRVTERNLMDEAWALIAIMASPPSQQALVRESTYIPTVREAGEPGWFGDREDLAVLYAEAARGIPAPPAACQARQSAELSRMLLDLHSGVDPAEVVARTQAALEAVGGE